MLTNTLVILAAGVVVVLNLAVATLLVQKYLRTHDVSVLWLLAAVFVWPPSAQLLAFGERLLLRHKVLGPFSTVSQLLLTTTYLRAIVGATLMFVAVSHLCKTQEAQQRPTA